MKTLTTDFLPLLKLVPDIPPPTCEYVFHKPQPGEKQRKWRFDVCWPKHLVAVELDGGVFFSAGDGKKSRHSGGIGQHKDSDKRNAAQEQGWIVLTYDRKHMDEQPMQIVEQIARVLGVLK